MFPTFRGIISMSSTLVLEAISIRTLSRQPAENWALGVVANGLGYMYTVRLCSCGGILQPQQRLHINY
jgi:hypothetical protein